MAEDSECKTDNFDERRQPRLGQTEKVESELVRESGNNTAMLGQDASLVTNVYISALLAPLSPKLTWARVNDSLRITWYSKCFNLFFFFFFQHAAPYVW